MTEVATTDRWLRLLGSLASAFMLVVLAACGGGGTGSTSPNTQTQSLTISPSTVGIEFGANPVTFVVAGGVKPYALTSSNQALLPVGGVGDDGRFQLTPAFAPDLATPVVITVRDALQATVTAQVTVAARLSGPLAVSPTSAEAAVGVPVTFTISGGANPYTVTSSAPSIVANPIAVDAAGRFTVTPASNPPQNATVTLTVRDSHNATVNATLTVTSLALAVNPTTVQAGPNQSVVFTISGGQAPYTVTSSQPGVVPNPTSIDAQGRFTLRAIVTPTTATPVEITIRDASGKVVTATMTVVPTTPIPLVVVPANQTVFTGFGGSLTIFGGTGPFQVFSSNPAILGVSINGNTVTLTPGSVDADTPVTVTIIDSQNTRVDATVTVKAAGLLNSLTVTPTPATPGAGCGAAVCAGQTASVSVTVRSPAGSGLSRSVRFENVQGNYQFITSGPGLPETLANSITVQPDQNGLAIVRLRADVNAPTQVALIRATELTSGSILNGSFVIAQFTDGAGTLTAIPTTWTVTGPDAAHCAANTPVTYYIFGGTPPYRIQSTLPGFVNIAPTIVQTNGGGFTAITTGTVCSPSPGTSITITDATGRTISVTLINAFGSGNPATNFNQIQFQPGDQTTPLGCGQSITEQITGGEIRLADGTIQTPTFVVSTLGPNVTATVSGRIITITRTAQGTTTSPAVIYVSNGVTTATLRIAVAESCGTDPAGLVTLQFNPSSPLVVKCAVGDSSSSTITAVITAGAPFTGNITYSASVLPANGLAATVNGNVLTVTRQSTVVAGSASIPVVVTGSYTDSAGAQTVTGTLFVAPPLSCTP